MIMKNEHLNFIFIGEDKENGSPTFFWVTNFFSIYFIFLACFFFSSLIFPFFYTHFLAYLLIFSKKISSSLSLSLSFFFPFPFSHTTNKSLLRINSQHPERCEPILMGIFLNHFDLNIERIKEVISFSLYENKKKMFPCDFDCWVDIFFLFFIL